MPSRAARSGFCVRQRNRIGLPSKFTVNSTAKAGDIDVSDSVTVQLVTNTVMSGAKERVIKQAQRDGLYRAFDVGEYWLSDALEALNSGR